MSGAGLVCTNLRRSFGRTTVLDGVDLAVAAGRALVLLGTSGAGKTTLLRIVAGLESADEGEVRLGERVLSAPSVLVPPEERGVGMVFQALELWPHMSVAEHIAFGLPGRPTGRAARKNATVRQLADEVGLDDALLRRHPSTLSGGEQQRVAIARTLAARPDVILYDEPLANLDPDRRRALRALIRRLAREHGTTVVYVTHDPDEALEIGDELVVLAAGRVVERGVPQEVYRTPRTLLGASALGPITALRGIWRGDRVETSLGSLVPAAGTASDEGATCTVVLRPESVVPAGEDGTEVLIEDAIARGPDWGFTAAFEGAPLYGRASDRVEPGTRLRVTAQGPVAVLEEAPAGEEAR